MKFDKKDKRTELEKQYDEAVTRLGTLAPMSKDYETQMVLVERLSKLIAAEKANKKQLDPNTMIGAGVGIFQVLSILSHERAHSIVTKAIGFVKKPK